MFRIDWFRNWKRITLSHNSDGLWIVETRSLDWRGRGVQFPIGLVELETIGL